MLNSLISAITNFQSANLQYATSISATKKALDTQEMQGNLALKLINSAAQPVSTAEINGKGSNLDLIG